MEFLAVQDIHVHISRITKWQNENASRERHLRHRINALKQILKDLHERPLS